MGLSGDVWVAVNRRIKPVFVSVLSVNVNLIYIAHLKTTIAAQSALEAQYSALKIVR